jgi:hypothetical protein
MGNTSRNTDSSPVCLRRFFGEASAWRNSAYELVCNSIMFGGLTISLILPKLIRSVARDGIFNFLLGAFLRRTGFFHSTTQSKPAAIRG